jgi:DNA processing protein
VKSPAELHLGDVERRVLDTIDSDGDRGAIDIDVVVAATGLAASQVLATVGVLEMRRLIRRLPGTQVVRN